MPSRRKEDFKKHVDETIHLYMGKGGSEAGFHALPEDIQHVLVNMTFNLGGTRFAKFNNMWKAVLAEDWLKMGEEMEDSRWYGQVGRRSKELQEMVLACYGS